MIREFGKGAKQSRTPYLIVRVKCFESYLFYLKVLTHRARQEEKENVELEELPIRKLKI